MRKEKLEGCQPSSDRQHPCELWYLWIPSWIMSIAAIVISVVRLLK